MYKLYTFLKFYKWFILIHVFFYQYNIGMTFNVSFLIELILILIIINSNKYIILNIIFFKLNLKLKLITNCNNFVIKLILNLKFLTILNVIDMFH